MNSLLGACTCRGSEVHALATRGAEVTDPLPEIPVIEIHNSSPDFDVNLQI